MWWSLAKSSSRLLGVTNGQATEFQLLSICFALKSECGTQVHVGMQGAADLTDVSLPLTLAPELAQH
jgi:hypothetical protein